MPVALTRKQLYQRVWSKPLSVVARELGVSGNALAKICNRLLVPYPSRGHWSKCAVGKNTVRPPLPLAPESQTRRVTISSVPAASRRSRSRLDPSTRREQLLDIAAEIIQNNGLHAATMKRIAAEAGISETQAYNYFRSRDQLFMAIARREYARIELARRTDSLQAHDHHSKIEITTRTYLRQIDRRGGLLQMLLSTPQVRNQLRDDQRKRNRENLRIHTQWLMDLYGISREEATGFTVVLTRLSLRAGQLIADKRISLESGERLCIAMILNGSRSMIRTRGSQSFKAA